MKEAVFGRQLQDTEELQQVFKLGVLPSADRDADETGDNLALKYSSFTIENDNSIVIKVDFENPAEISMADSYDKLKVSIDRT